MVNITPEEFMARKKAPDPNSLSQLDKDIIGETCRLEIPFRDVYAMRQTADLLRGYAEELDFYSRRTDLPARTILFHLRSQAKQLNYRLRELRGPARRKTFLDPE